MAKMMPMRDAYGAALVALGKANEKVVALSADVSNSDFSWMFEAAFPERF
jgi:transketolase